MVVDFQAALGGCVRISGGPGLLPGPCGPPEKGRAPVVFTMFQLHDLLLHRGSLLARRPSSLQCCPASPRAVCSGGSFSGCTGRKRGAGAARILSARLGLSCSTPGPMASPPPAQQAPGPGLVSLGCSRVGPSRAHVLLPVPRPEENELFPGFKM